MPAHHSNSPQGQPCGRTSRTAAALDARGQARARHARSAEPDRGGACRAGLERRTHVAARAVDARGCAGGRAAGMAAMMLIFRKGRNEIGDGRKKMRVFWSKFFNKHDEEVRNGISPRFVNL
jgi:hypothetical protein